ncbi:MAG: metalloregulator ArsR/SmtB family transcription factor [Planctomycetota bacterium]
MIETASIPVTVRLSALSEPVRLRIVRVLELHELSVGEVASVVQLPQSTVSRHLKLLANAGWVSKRPIGTATFYALVVDELADDARALWQAVRDGIDPEDADIRADNRRVRSVLENRKADSRAFFGRKAGEWDEIRRELFGEHFTALGLLSLVPPTWTVADFGCGTGNAAELLAPHVRRVIAIDQSQPMLDAARQRLGEVSNVEFVEGAIESAPLANDSVDASVMVLVLHHIAEPADAIREMARVTQPGGVVAVVDMHAHSHTDFRQTMGHRHLGFSEAEIADQFLRAGLKPPRIHTLPGGVPSRGPDLFVASAMVPSPDDEL